MNVAITQEAPTAKNLPLLGFLKENDQDFEWYPTTEEILTCIKNNLRERFYDRFRGPVEEPPKVLS